MYNKYDNRFNKFMLHPKSNLRRKDINYNYLELRFC